MPRALRDRRTLAGALLASLALHALGMPFFARSSSPESGGFGGNGRPSNERERSTVVSRMTIESRRAIHVMRAPTRPAKQLAHRALTSPATSEASVVATRDARPKQKPVQRSGNGRGAGRTRVAIALTIATAAPESQSHFLRPSARERAEIAVPATRTPTPSPLATTESTPVVVLIPMAPARVVATSTQTGVPAGGWGASFENPLFADDSALDDLRARYRGARTIRVDVDEAGHAIRVVVPASMAPDLRSALERDLFALRYIPAECNGLRCGGTLQLNL